MRSSLTFHISMVLTALALASLVFPAAAAPGDLDLTFGDAGKVITAMGADAGANGVVVQSDGKIVTAGWSSQDFALVRYDPDGSLDTTFNGTGKVTTDFGGSDSATSVALQSDGRIVAAGFTHTGKDKIGVARYLVDGSLDTSFNFTGKVTTSIYPTSSDRASGIAVQSDGKIVVAGYAALPSGSVVVVLRYNADGTPDFQFNLGRPVTTSYGTSAVANAVVLQSDGRIVVAGHTMNGLSSSFMLVRYTTDGTLDSSFAGSGKVQTDFGTDSSASSLALQSDGKLVAAGMARTNGTPNFALARYNPNGSPDTSFNGTGKVVTAIGSNDVASDVVVQSDGRIVATGFTFNSENNGQFALGSLQHERRSRRKFPGWNSDRLFWDRF